MRRDIAANDYHWSVGYICALHGQYVEGLLQDVALLCERSSANNERNRDLTQQRDPKIRRRTVDEMKTLLSSRIPDIDTFFERVNAFTLLRDKYAHAYLVEDESGQLCVQHLPSMKHNEAGLTVFLDKAQSEIDHGVVSFAPFVTAIRRMYEAAVANSGLDMGYRVPVFNSKEPPTS